MKLLRLLLITKYLVPACIYLLFNLSVVAKVIVWEPTQFPVCPPTSVPNVWLCVSGNLLPLCSTSWQEALWKTGLSQLQRNVTFLSKITDVSLDFWEQFQPFSLWCLGKVFPDWHLNEHKSLWSKLFFLQQISERRQRIRFHLQHLGTLRSFENIRHLGEKKQILSVLELH